MENDPYINPNPDEPLFTRPLTPREFLAAVRDCGQSVLQYTKSVSLRLQQWNITLDSDHTARRNAYYRNGLAMFATNYSSFPRFTRQYSYLLLLAEMLNAWHVTFEQYRQGCECDVCNDTHIDYVMCDEYIKGLAAVEITE